MVARVNAHDLGDAKNRIAFGVERTFSEGKHNHSWFQQILHEVKHYEYNIPFQISSPIERFNTLRV